MFNNEKISVGILAQSDTDLLRRTISSIYAQRGVSFEVIIVDNGSVKPISSTLSQYPNMHFVRHESDLGYSVGKNAAVAQATSEYIFLIDDDIVLPDEYYLRNLLDSYISLKDAAFLGAMLVDEGSQLTRYYGMTYTIYGLDFFRKPRFLNEVVSTIPRRIGSFHGGAVFFKKDIWTKLGGYDTQQPIMHDDSDISARARIMGFENYLYCNSVAIHTGKAKDNDKKRFARKYKFFYSGFAGAMLKNYSFVTLLFLLPIFTLFTFVFQILLTLKKRNLFIPGAFMLSYIRFMCDVPFLLKRRFEIQQNRVSSDFSFIKIL